MKRIITSLGLIGLTRGCATTSDIVPYGKELICFLLAIFGVKGTGTKHLDVLIWYYPHTHKV
jgi:hypothetical protein